MVGQPLKIALLAIGFFAASSVFGQQSTTNTNCQANGGSINCTSNTTTNDPPPDPLAGFNKAMADYRARMEANRSRRAQAKTDADARQAIEDRAKINIVYCKHNSGAVPTDEGTTRSCADELAYEKAFCSVKPDSDRCQLLASRAEFEKAFAELAEKYKYDPRANKKDCKMYYDSLFSKLRSAACLSYPDMQTPLRDGTLQPCSADPKPR